MFSGLYKIDGHIGLAPRDGLKHHDDDTSFPSFFANLQNSYDDKDNRLKPIIGFFFYEGYFKYGLLTVSDINIAKFGKKGLTEDDIHWMSIESNTNYWSARMANSNILSTGINRSVIFDTAFEGLAVVPIEDLEAA